MSNNETAAYSHPLITERAIDETRPLKVAFIGAGLSGVVASIILPKYVPKIKLTIYEKNEDVGGTWFENTYPGCACDIPAHTYQLSFESNVEWSKFYVGAPEIQRYWRYVVDKYNVRQFIKFKHKCIEAHWDKDLKKWRVKIEDLTSGSVFEDISDVLITGQGILNDWKLPDIEGLQDFKGRVLHSAKWDSTYDPKDDTVAVIGSGSSGIQIVPTLQKQVKHMDHYVRSSTWISTTFGHEMVRGRNNGEDGNFEYTPEEISTWKSKPEAYKQYRRSIELAMQKGYSATHLNSAGLKGATDFFEATMRTRLSSAPSTLTNHLIPTFPPFCRRLTPGIGYLEALTAPNVTTHTTPISHITPTGITTTDNTHHPVNTIICATGFNTTYLNRLPIHGTTTSLDTRYSTSRPESYLSLTLDTFPNYISILGPNSGHVNGNFVILVERLTTYTGLLLQRLSQSNVQTIEPLPSAVKYFTDFAEAFFARTVFAQECDSWYKVPKSPGGDRKTGRVTGLWPGSCAHAMKALERVRWEDYVIGYADQEKPCGWLGNGFSAAEVNGDDEALVAFLDGNLPGLGMGMVEPPKSLGSVSMATSTSNGESSGSVVGDGSEVDVEDTVPIAEKVTATTKLVELNAAPIVVSVN